MVRMLVTRPEPEASETAARLRALDIEPIVAPLLRFSALPTIIPDPAAFAGLVVTSSNALRVIEQRGDLQAVRHLPLFCVGHRTAVAGHELGFSRVTSAAGNVHDLVKVIADAEPRGSMLYLAGRQRSADLGKALAARGILVITVDVYEMSAATALPARVPAALEDGSIAASLFYSRRTAETFVSLTAEVGARSRLGVLCLSEAVAAPLVAAHFVRVGLADHPSEEAMMALALSFARDQNPA